MLERIAFAALTTHPLMPVSMPGLEFLCRLETTRDSSVKGFPVSVWIRAEGEDIIAAVVRYQKFDATNREAIDNQGLTKEHAWSIRDIVADPAVLGGKPAIKGTRISVEFLIQWPAQGWTEGELLENYPRLTAKHLQAVFAYVKECIEDGPLISHCPQYGIGGAE